MLYLTISTSIYHFLVLRNRASPTRLVKLYRVMSEDQRKMIRDVHFDGLLKIECSTIPAEFANLLMVECFNADTSELVLPGRGRISVTTQSIADILHLPSKGAEVKYELDVDAINFIHKYDILQGSAPKIDEIIKRIKNNKDKNEDFLKSQLMIAVLTFLCPPTSFRISPRCYPSLVDVSRVKKLNWCQFVVNQLKVAAKKINTKNSVKGCILLLVIIYADSLTIQNVQIPATMPRIAAWTRKLLDEVIKLEMNGDGSFGKLKLKPSHIQWCRTLLSKWMTYIALHHQKFREIWHQRRWGSS
ncbi:uncharacterized protein LOC112897687 isoform X3 [Panicum hallii]|uniref:uncharacterized protein LOC112897687 isoform X3 n=1 Tax=Panicum hallii TaxID=206008 RepID=UPI000DF4CBF3|nr:uncharacterized protein LOC112897687 isoform X3 [Panicum hallii]